MRETRVRRLLQITTESLSTQITQNLHDLSESTFAFVCAVHAFPNPVTETAVGLHKRNAYWH